MVLLGVSDNILLIIWAVLMMYFCSRQYRFELLVFSTYIKEIDANLKIITVGSFVEGKGSVISLWKLLHNNIKKYIYIFLNVISGYQYWFINKWDHFRGRKLMQNSETMDMLICSVMDFHREAINSPDSVKHICWLS